MHGVIANRRGIARGQGPTEFSETGGGPGAKSPHSLWTVLFGIGLNRPPRRGGSNSSSVSTIKNPVLAVDVPSGLNADTGRNFGAAIEAAVDVDHRRAKTCCGKRRDGRSLEPIRKWRWTRGFDSIPHATDLHWSLPKISKAFRPLRVRWRAQYSDISPSSRAASAITAQRC